MRVGRIAPQIIPFLAVALDLIKRGRIGITQHQTGRFRAGQIQRPFNDPGHSIVNARKRRAGPSQVIFAQFFLNGTQLFGKKRAARLSQHNPGEMVPALSRRLNLNPLLELRTQHRMRAILILVVRLPVNTYLPALAACVFARGPGATKLLIMVGLLLKEGFRHGKDGLRTSPRC